jgi:hypothetical protein
MIAEWDNTVNLRRPFPRKLEELKSLVAPNQSASAE